MDEWRTRADDCLVFGSSLVGARKRFLAQPLVRYRVHSRNNFCGSKPDPIAIYRRRLAINRLFEYLQRQRFYNVPQLADFPHREFKTIEKPSFNQFLGYSRISLGARLSLFRRLSCIASMFQHLVVESGRNGFFRPGHVVGPDQEAMIAGSCCENVEQSLPRKMDHETSPRSTPARAAG
jgi:hypothetical protein